MLFNIQLDCSPMDNDQLQVGIMIFMNNVTIVSRALTALAQFCVPVYHAQEEV